MRNLRFESIVLVSRRERKSIKVDFHPTTNIIQGKNDTGKSSLIKSLYSCLGTEPHNVNDRWKSADVTSFLRFEVDSKTFSIYRQRDTYALFDSADAPIGIFTSVTKQLAPRLAEILDFRLQLSDRKGASQVPPPAYCFLPFYIDQDKGWQSTWNSFKNLNQFPQWKRAVISYHFGIRPNEWHALDARKRNLLNDLDEPQQSVKALKELLRRARQEHPHIDFDIDIERFQQELNELLEECRHLKKREDEYRFQMSGLGNERIRLEAQVEIVERTYQELNKDYQFASEDLGDSVDCPTCGAAHQNGFSERFGIAQDTETCDDLAQSLRDDLRQVDTKIAELKSSLANTEDERTRITQLLDEKQEDLALRDLLELEGRKQYVEKVRASIDESQVRISGIRDEIDSIEKQMSVFEDRKRSSAIRQQYANDMRKFTAELNTHLDKRVYERIDASISESGSDLPRAILAYQYAVLNSIEINGNATFCPVVIDAPNQQDQDEDNLPRVINFIAQNHPKGRQLILALRDTCGVDFEGSSLVLDNEYSLLQEADYSEHSSLIEHYKGLIRAMD